MHRSLLHLLFCLCTALAGCATGGERARPAHAEASAPLRSLDERTALALIDELLREARWHPVASWRVAVPPRNEFEVDVRLGDTDFGIEWVSADDRNQYGQLLPPPGPGGQLRLLTGTGSSGQSAKAQILVLDHESYRFAARGDSSGDGTIDLHDVEQQLRRDLTEFIEYARSQYRL